MSDIHVKNLKKFRGGIRLDTSRDETELLGTDAEAEGTLIYDKNTKGLKIRNEGGFAAVGGGSGGGLDTFYTEDFTTQALADGNTGTDKFVRTVTGTGGKTAISFTSDADEISERSLKITLGDDTDSLTSPAIVLKKRQQGQTCSISFYYKTDTFVDDDMKLEVLSGTSIGAISTSLVSENIKASTTIKKFVTTFTIPSDATHLQYKFINKSTSGTKLIYVDDVEISQDPFVQADLGTITEWKPWDNPTWGSSLTVGNAEQSWKYRRVGDTIHVQGQFKWGSTTSMSSGDVQIILPQGYKIDLSKTADSSAHFSAPASNYPDYVMLEGWASYWSEGEGAASIQGHLWRIITNGYSDNTLYIAGRRHEGTSGTWTNAAPEAWENNDIWVFNFSFPVQGWGSTNTHIVTPAKSNLTNWQSYSLTDASDLKLNSLTNIDTNATQGQWRRVGDSMEVKFTIRWSGNGDSGTLKIKLPGSYQIDSSKLPDTNDAGGTVGTGFLGSAYWFDDAASDMHADLIIVRSSSSPSDAVQLAGDYPDGVSTGVFSSGLSTNDRVSGTFTVPIVGWGSQDSNFLAALPMTKWQRKNMSTSVVDGNAWVHKGTNTGFKFENLTVGKTYKLTLNAQVQVDKEDKDAIFSAYHGGTTDSHALIKLVNYRSQDPPGSADYTPGISEQHKAGTVIFTAVSGTDVDGNTGCFVHFYWSASAGQIGGGSSGYERTFAILEEISMHEETDIW